MKKNGIISSLRTAWKDIYKNHRWVRGLHIFLQYVIILISGPIIIFALEYVWEERPSLLFITIPGLYFTVCSVYYFFRNKKIRRSIEDEGKLPKEIRKKIVHDMIIIAEIFAIYTVIKCLIKYVFAN